ncbi:hypothetical protein K435DRAFT_90204 [Dendrothele bispora CBS 962.96]|uniref:Uncharacterized protein n=1 Tax=Dendrothele bispora (strain CBS 962.96) TaxID=1314807 RepID=A0A4V4HB03_DENBC|nr:hypothetical protein K435DRAFT_90204 [Dendrothele bispora CBS 962.96]
MLASDHSQSFSLFTSSRNSGVEEYPVPELIKSLIRYAGVEICSPTFLQFTLSPYEFISMARDIRDEINRLVSKLDSSTSEEDVWNDFDRYTGLIDPTEDALLNFLEIVERESRWLSLNDDGAFASMENYQSWIEQWVDRRMGLYRFLSRLVDQNKKLSEDYINSFLRQNTKAFMQDLYRRMEVALQDMKKNGKEIPPEASKTLTSLRRMIEEFGSHPFNGPIADV